MRPAPAKTYQKIYAVVRRVPHGRVATYGLIATLSGLAGQARQVGYALHALRDDALVPWHRVINAQGRVSPRSEPGFEKIQRQLLEGEGVVFENDHVSFRRFGWSPRHRVGKTNRPAQSRNP